MIRADQTGAQLVVLSRGGLTALDGGQVQGEVPLYDGSEIHFGQLSFVFRSHGAPRRPASAGASSSFGAMPISAPPTNGSPGMHNGGGMQPQMQSPSNAGGWDSSSGSWGQADWDAPSASEPAPAPVEAENHLVTWDEIANSAEARDDGTAGMTDFQKIQAAQAKADKQTRGNNPWIVYGGVLGIVAMIVVFVWPFEKAGEIGDDVDVSQDSDQAFISWADGDIDCVGKANCREAALSAYRVGKNLKEQAGADITNPFQAYAQFDKAQLYLKKGGIQPPPVEMANVLDMQTAVKVDLDAKFNQARVNYLNWKNRKMYRKMAEELNRIQAYFPDKRCLYNQWAVEKERKMKDDRIYPAANIY